MIDILARFPNIGKTLVTFFDRKQKTSLSHQNKSTQILNLETVFFFFKPQKFFLQFLQLNQVCEAICHLLMLLILHIKRSRK